MKTEITEWVSLLDFTQTDSLSAIDAQMRTLAKQIQPALRQATGKELHLDWINPDCEENIKREAGFFKITVA